MLRCDDADRRAPKRQRLAPPMAASDAAAGAAAAVVAALAATQDNQSPRDGKTAGAGGCQHSGGAAAAAAVRPLWHGNRGMIRLAAELEAVTDAVARGDLPQACLDSLKPAVAYQIVTGHLRSKMHVEC